MFSVYAISSIYKNYIYVGLSSEVTTRVKRHNSKLNKSTAPYAPFITVMVEEVSGIRSEARAREKYWKSGTGKRKLKILRDKLSNL
jgi:putative endonuclease